MKRIVGILAFMIVISMNLFAATEANFVGNATKTTDTTKEKIVEKIYIDKYFSMNLVLGITSSPIVIDDILLASGLEINFYKYYGTKNYGTNLKLTVLGEGKTYGSYKITPGLVYRINLKDNLELFTGVGSSFTFYNMMLNDNGFVNLFYIGLDGELGLRYYPIKNNHNISLDAGFDGGYMWKVAIGSNLGIVTRYQFTAFLGFSYIFNKIQL